MKAAVFLEPGKVETQDVPKPQLQKPTDAIIKIVRASVCGSDLWWFRGISHRDANSLVGHEAIGIVEEVGAEVMIFMSVILSLRRLHMVAVTVRLVLPVLMVIA